MLFRRLDLSSVSHAWNCDKSKHNGRGWGGAWKTRLLLWAVAAAGYTDAPRNRANIGATEFSPYIHHFSALSTKGRLGNSYEEVVFATYSFKQTAENDLLKHYVFSMSYILLECRSCTHLSWKATSWALCLQPPAETDASQGAYKVVEKHGRECHWYLLPLWHHKGRLSEKKAS